MFDAVKLVWRQVLLAVGLVPFRDYAEVIIMLDDARRENIRLQKQVNAALATTRDFVHNVNDIFEASNNDQLSSAPDPQA